jgi:hypothetical protein
LPAAAISGEVGTPPFPMTSTVGSALRLLMATDAFAVELLTDGTSTFTVQSRTVRTAVSPRERFPMYRVSKALSG